jgi:serine/threonine protein kinase
MSMLQTTAEQSASGNLHCPQCDTALPPHATFCSSCGERISREKKGTRYHVTSLLRRRPYVSLYFATDSHLQRMVAIRDIDISSLDEEAQAKAAEIVRDEYDQLRRQPVPHVMPVIDLQVNQDHLLTISGQPLPGSDRQNKVSTRLRTLQDFLQSSKLPAQQVAFSWISGLCLSVESLHAQQIVIGDLDPHAIVLSGDDFRSQPMLIVSWLPPQMRTLFPRIVSEGEPASATAEATPFSAPEVLLGKVEPSSDVYSIGAILYLLLTGTTPDDAVQRMHHRLYTPREINPRISSSVDEIVMRTLSFEWSERFPSAKALAEALPNGRVSQPLKAQTALPRPSEDENDAQQLKRIADIDTIDVTSLSQADPTPWETSKSQTNSPPAAPTVEGTIQQFPGTGDAPLSPKRSEQAVDHPNNISASDNSENAFLPLPQRFKERITDMLPVLPRLSKQITGVLPPLPHTPRPQRLTTVQQQPGEPLHGTQSAPTEEQALADRDVSLLKQIQRVVLGEQQHTTAAAAVVETPLRVQPNQPYIVRIRLMGRDEPGTPPGTKKGTASKGLSAQVSGDLIYVEVRSTLHQNYTYIVQQAVVNIPALGYVAEVVMPMQPFSAQSDGRRERLNIFFMDETHRPLYTKPFVIELFVSHLVQLGREGHHVLPIPM